MSGRCLRVALITRPCGFFLRCSRWRRALQLARAAPVQTSVHLVDSTKRTNICKTAVVIIVAQCRTFALRPLRSR
jgi:hypothetical protein